MKQNVGSLDKGVRIALGLLLSVVSMTAISLQPWPASTTAAVAGGGLVVAAVLFITATTETCPLYGIFGVDTLDE